MPTKPKPDPTPNALPEFASYRATADLFIEGIGTVPANGVIEVDPASATVAAFIAQGLLVK
jgi:hypothetical protein